MIIGSHTGVKVSDAKGLVKKELIDSGEALVYYEPGGKVISRSRDECIVNYYNK